MVNPGRSGTAEHGVHRVQRLVAKGPGLPA